MLIEIWSDIACPWCYIGKVRFEAALERYEHRDAVQVRWRSFELAPAAPKVDPPSTSEHLMAKYGRSREQVAEMMARVTEVAAAEGLDYRLGDAVAANTFDAHRLVLLAAALDPADGGRAMMTRLMRAYQCEGADVSDSATLVRLGAECGLDDGRVTRMLASTDHADAVRADERRAKSLGVDGVPFFVIDEAHGVSGAQPSEFFLEALRQLGPKGGPVTLLTGTAATDAAAACTDDGCEVPQA